MLRRVVTFFKLVPLVLLIAVLPACTGESAQDASRAYANPTAQVPILMYHDFREEAVPGNNVVMSVATFRVHMQAIYDRGFSTVTFRCLIDFVDYGTPLPPNPIVITFDDGYMSNLIYAAPILEEFGLRATINVIGISRGRITYRGTDIPIIPHFGWDDVRPWVERGVIQIGHHSYDMHRWHRLPGEPWRYGVLPMEGECDEAYKEALTADFERLRNIIYEELGKGVYVFAYTYGLYNAQAEEILQGLGVRVTLSVHADTNTIVQGDPGSLFLLNRLNMTEGVDIDRLLDYLHTR